MQRADFYQLKSDDLASRYPLLCRLLEKAVGSGQQVYIQCRDDAEASHLDVYIWAFKPDSFIAHVCAGDDAVAPIVLGHPNTAEENYPKQRDICLNLSHQLAPKEFERIIEVVTQDPDMILITRQHYRSYQQQGRSMQYHKL
ncbi:MAG: DNA polymerase III subunit chi [Oceanospirillaceae bacterium]|nr:DNA polymerase III subunit chi [Oceanospirillaceae bacterium]